MKRHKINKFSFIDGTKKWFTDYAGYGKDEQPKAVIGISGGKDSSVVAALVANAIGPENVLGIMMPNGHQKDISDSMELVEHLGIYNTVINIGKAYEGLIEYIDAGLPTDSIGAPTGLPPIREDKRVITNLPARLRMATLYAIANRENRRVIGTGNFAEGICGYYTLWGDGACDFDPIADLYVDEVIELGRQLGVPEKFLVKIPDDGMSGVPDEEKLGFRYSDVKVYYETSRDSAIEKLGIATYEKIDKKVKSAHFKRMLTNIPYLKVNGDLFVKGDVYWT